MSLQSPKQLELDLSKRLQSRRKSQSAELPHLVPYGNAASIHDASGTLVAYHVGFSGDIEAIYGRIAKAGGAVYQIEGKSDELIVVLSSMAKFQGGEAIVEDDVSAQLLWVAALGPQ